MTIRRIDVYQCDTQENAEAWEALEAADEPRFVFPLETVWYCAAVGHTGGAIDQPSGFLGVEMAHEYDDLEGALTPLGAILSYGTLPVVATVYGAGPKRPENRDCRLYPFLVPAKRNADLANLNWDDWQSNLLGSPERVYVWGTGASTGDIVEEHVYGPGQTEINPYNGQCVAKNGALPFAVETITYLAEGPVGPLARQRVVTLLNNDGSEYSSFTKIKTYDANASEQAGRTRRANADREARVILAGAILATGATDPSDLGDQFAVAVGDAAITRFMDRGNAAPLQAALDAVQGAGTFPWYTQGVHAMVRAKYDRWVTGA